MLLPPSTSSICAPNLSTPGITLDRYHVICPSMFSGEWNEAGLLQDCQKPTCLISRSVIIHVTPDVFVVTWQTGHFWNSVFYDKKIITAWHDRWQAAQTTSFTCATFSNMRRGYFRKCSSVSMQPSYFHHQKTTNCNYIYFLCLSFLQWAASVWVFLDIMWREYTLFNTYKVFLQASCYESQNMNPPLCDFCAELLWTVSSSVPPWLHVHPVLTFTVCLVVKDSWWSAFELRKKSSYLNFVVIIWG